MHINTAQKLRKDKNAQAGIIIIILLLIFAIAVPIFTKAPDVFSEKILARPDCENLLGTNDIGQDIFSRLIYGLRTSLLVSVSTGLISTAISVVIGVLAGFKGGLLDIIFMRFIDAFLVLPVILVLIFVSVFIKPGIINLIILISLFQWQGTARIIRGQTLALKEKTHIYAAATFGSKKSYLLVRHIIPDLGHIIVVSFIYNARAAVFMEAGMAFIGVSNPSTISLGKIMHDAFKFYYLPAWVWWLLPAGLLLSMLLVSLTFLGNLMEKIIDPRLQNA
ncbi:MAG: ABC transporter permease [Actinomycetota bacterium]|nr:ABC transporter permease [Actinomycetota bacterium]